MRNVLHSFAKLPLLLAVSVALSGCIFDDEPDPVTTEQVQPDYPPGPALFTEQKFGRFKHHFDYAFSKLTQTDPGKADQVLRGMAKILAYQGLTVDEQAIASQQFEVDPFDGLEPGTEEFLLKFHSAVADRLEGGVTFDSIIKMGEAHEQNAVTLYRNAAVKQIQSLNGQEEELRQKQRKLLAVMGKVAIISPSVVSEGDAHRLTVELINNSEARVSELLLDLRIPSGSSASVEGPRGWQTTLTFHRPLLPGERRSIAMQIEPAGTPGPSIDEPVDVIASVAKLSSDEGWEITGREYDPAFQLIGETRSVFQRYMDEIRGVLRGKAMELDTGTSSSR